MPSQSSVPLLQAQGSGFPPQSVDAVWLSRTEAAVAISDRWAIVPGQGVRLMGPVDDTTHQPAWQAVAKVESVQPYLDGQRLSLSSCWGSIAANVAWLEGLATPIEFLLDALLAQHPTARSMQLLGQPIGLAYPLQGQGWQLTGTCVAGKQAVLKELLTGFTAGWILDASGWYDSTLWASPNTQPTLELNPAQRFDMARNLCQSLKEVLSASEQTTLMQASTANEPSLWRFVAALQSAVPSLPALSSKALQGAYWNFSQVPPCWHKALGNFWRQHLLKHPPAVVVLIWPEAILNHCQALFQTLREQGCCVIWIPLGAGLSAPNDHGNKDHGNKDHWNHVIADIAWPLEAMESDALGSVLSTQTLPYDVAFTVQGPVTWQLPIIWTLPGAVLPAGPVEWQAYGVQQSSPVVASSEDFLETHPTEFIQSHTEPTVTLQNNDSLSLHPTPPEEPYSVSVNEPSVGLMAELGPLPDLSDLSSVYMTMEDRSVSSEVLPSVLPEAPLVKETLPSPTPMEGPMSLPSMALPPKPAKTNTTATHTTLTTGTVWAEGQGVHHPKYGHGTIIQVIPTGKRHTLQVQFKTAGTRLVDATQSGLEPS